jgi:hypothetical protein
MNSRLTEDFVALFARLPTEIKAQARRNYRLWRVNPAHPGLHFKRIQGQNDLYSVRVGLGWRAVGFLEGDTMNWFWIGSHAEYDNLIKRL